MKIVPARVFSPKLQVTMRNGFVSANPLHETAVGAPKKVHLS